MAVIHISEEEAARDLPAVLAKVRAGEHVQIDGEDDVIELAARPRIPSPECAVRYSQPRPIAAMLAELKERGSHARLDGGYGKYLEEVIEAGQRERRVDWDRS